MKNLPILICALLLHLNSLIQLAVRGAKIVIPFHFDFVHNSPSVCLLWLSDVLLLRFVRSASVWSAQLSHGVISTLLPASRGGDPGQSSQSQGGRGFEWQRSWSKQILVRFDKSERRKKRKDISLCGCFWKLLKCSISEPDNERRPQLSFYKNIFILFIANTPKVIVTVQILNCCGPWAVCNVTLLALINSQRYKNWL